MEPQNESATAAAAATPTLGSPSAAPPAAAPPAAPAEEGAPVGTGVTDERVAEYESTADEPEKPGAFQRWYDHVTDD